MKRFALLALASGMAIVAATPANAAILIGTFNVSGLSGSYVNSGPGANNANNATGLDFGTAGGVGNGFGTNGSGTLALGTGSFAAYNNTAVSVSDISLAAFANPNTNPFLTIGSGAGQILVSFTNATIQRDPTSITVAGSASFLNGGNTSFGSFTLSTSNQSGNASGSNFSFTSNSVATGAVPEPATWGMMIVGFGLMGGVLRRRSTKVAFA